MLSAEQKRNIADIHAFLKAQGWNRKERREFIKSIKRGAKHENKHTIFTVENPEPLFFHREERDDEARLRSKKEKGK